MPAFDDRREWRFAGRWLCLYAALFGLLFLGGGAAVGADSPVSKEYQIKAAFLYNFTKFIEWPGRCFSNTSDAIVIGVLGPAEFGAELEKIVKDRKVNGRGIIVKSVGATEEVGAVHVLFVSAADGARFEEFWPLIESRPILAIGESPLFTQTGGTINFVLEQDKVNFEINMDSAERAGLRVSAHLQKLAKVIRKRP